MDHRKLISSALLLIMIDFLYTFFSYDQNFGVSTLLGNTCAQACSCACCSCFIYTYTAFVLSSDDTRSEISFTTQGILIVLLFCRSYILIRSIIIENFLITNVGILYTFMSCVSTIRCSRMPMYAVSYRKQRCYKRLCKVGTLHCYTSSVDRYLQA